MHEASPAGEPLSTQGRSGRHRAGGSGRGRRLPSRGLSERHTAIALSALPEDEWMVRHEVEWSEPEEGFADHVVVGPLGVFLIDSQHWPDAALVEGDTVWRRGRPWPWATRRASTSADQISALLDDVDGLRPEYVVPVVSLYGVGPIDGHAGRVVVASPTTVCRLLLQHPPVLDAAQVIAVSFRLRRALRPAAALTS